MMARHRYATAPTSAEVRKILKRGGYLHVVDLGETSRSDVSGLWATDSYCAVRVDAMPPATIPESGTWKATGSWWVTSTNRATLERGSMAGILTGAVGNASRPVTLRETIDARLNVGGTDDPGSCILLRPDDTTERDDADVIALHLRYLPFVRWAAREVGITLHAADRHRPVIVKNRQHDVIAVIMPARLEAAR